MRTLSIAVPTMSDVKASAVEFKNDAIALGKGIAADPKTAAVAVGKEVTKPSFVVGVCLGIAGALAIKNMVS